MTTFTSHETFRQKTARMSGGGNTFSCDGCGKFRQIVGRKRIPTPGRIHKYRCAECSYKTRQEKEKS